MFNVIKCYKVKKTTLAKVSNHTHRTKLTATEQARICHTKTANNRVLVGSNVSADVRNRIKNYSTNKTRKDAVYCEHYVISASPEFFKKYPGRTEEWVNEQISFLKAEFGPNLTTAVLHMDEQTPHIEAFVTPIIANPKTGKLELNRKAFNNARGGLNSFTALQTSHAEHNQKFGLKRGEPKTKTAITAQDLNTYYKNVYKYVKRLEQYKPPIAEQLMPSKKMGFLYSYNDVLEALKKALKIASKTYVQALTLKEKYKNKYNQLKNVKRDMQKEIEKANKDYKTVLKTATLLRKDIKKQNVIIEQYKQELEKQEPLLQLAKKVSSLGLNEFVESEYKAKVIETEKINKQEPVQQQQNKKGINLTL